MKKPFNLRLPVLSAAALAAGITFSATLAYFGLSGIYIFIPAAISLAACVPVAIFFKSASKPLIFIFAALLFLVGAMYAYGKCCAFIQPSVPADIAVGVTGRVEEVGETSGEKIYLIVGNVKADGAPLGGKLIAYLGENAGEYCRRGYTVSFSSVLAKEELFDGGAFSYRATRNIRYYCTVVGGLQSEYGFSLFGEINEALRGALFDNLDGETAAVCYAMLTGNTEAVSEGTLQSFRNGGIAHVFAVSGLHIGVIYGALSLILGKIKLNRGISAAVKIAVITLYAGVCGFSPSSVRALVMCSTSAISSCVYRKYDGWNSLSIAAVILLILNPLKLFGAGFTLSFAAVTGIILLSSNLKRAFGFLPAKLRSGLSVSLSAQFATAPALVASFGYVSAAGLFLNVIFVPVISLLYAILFVCATIGAFVPFIASHVLPAAVLPLQLTVNFITSCGFDNAIVSAGAGNWLFVPFIAVTIALSDKFNFGRKLFWRGAVIVAALLSVMITSVARSGKAATSVTFGSGYAGGSVLIKTDCGAVLVITDNYRSDVVPVGVSALVVLGDEDNLSAVLALGGVFGEIYVRASAAPVSGIGPSEIIYSDDFEACGVAFSFDGGALVARTEGVSVVVVREEYGAAYGSQLRPADFNLYCYGTDGAVLFAEDKDFDLSFCGDMRYEIVNGAVRPSYVIPKE